MFGDGNSQFIEILPPRLAGTNKTYTLQVALDGKNFLDVPTVKLTVNNESVKGQEADGVQWVECGKEDLFNITATYIDEKTGKEIASPYKAQGYIISEWETYTPSIQAKDIEGYELVSAPDMSKYKGFIGEKKDYNFVFKYKKSADKVALEKAIEKAEAIKKGNYTDESWNALQKAIKEAKVVLEDNKATQEQIEKQVKALEDAIKALKTKPEPGKPNPEKPENPDKPVTPNKPGANDPVIGDTTKPNGNKVVFDKGSGKGIRFNTGIDFDDFDKVIINGKVVDPKYYTVEKSSDGKAIIVLKNSYLEKLGNGKYTFEVVAKDGTTEKATFTVKAKASEGTTPKTGDTTQPFVYVVGMLIAIGAVAVIFGRKRTTK